MCYKTWIHNYLKFLCMLYYSWIFWMYVTNFELKLCGSLVTSYGMMFIIFKRYTSFFGVYRLQNIISGLSLFFMCHNLWIFFKYVWSTLFEIKLCGSIGGQPIIWYSLFSKGGVTFFYGLCFMKQDIRIILIFCVY